MADIWCCARSRAARSSSAVRRLRGGVARAPHVLQHVVPANHADRLTVHQLFGSPQVKGVQCSYMNTRSRGCVGEHMLESGYMSSSRELCNRQCLRKLHSVLYRLDACKAAPLQAACETAPACTTCKDHAGCVGLAKGRHGCRRRADAFTLVC